MIPKDRRKEALWAGACGITLLLAVVWTGLHLNWQTRGQTVALSFSSAATRQEERMETKFPEGNVAVNTATVDELCQLTGVGRSIAEAIIAEREANGPFAFPEDLLSVKGIGEKKLAGFLDQIILK